METLNGASEEAFGQRGWRLLAPWGDESKLRVNFISFPISARLSNTSQ